MGHGAVEAEGILDQVSGLRLRAEGGSGEATVQSPFFGCFSDSIDFVLNTFAPKLITPLELSFGGAALVM